MISYKSLVLAIFMLPIVPSLHYGRLRLFLLVTSHLVNVTGHISQKPTFSYVTNYTHQGEVTNEKRPILL